MVERFIRVKFQKEGIHCYPAAATDPKLACGGKFDVSFLASEHRHMFHFYVTISVTHNDRDIEFIQCKRWMESLYSDGVMHINHKSCEMLAEELIVALQSMYGYDRRYDVEVYEDDENGGIVTYNPEEEQNA